MDAPPPCDSDAPPGLRRDVPLAPYTTLGLGGPAAFFLECASDQDLLRGLRFAMDRGLRVFVLGAGSNVVVSDAGFDGLALRVATRGMVFRDDGDSVIVEARAGERWDSLVERCVERGLAGVECLSGIPGTVGATPVQNVGAYGQDVAQTLLEVRGLDRAGLAPVRMSAGRCGFGYRTSRFKAADRDRFLITGVTLRLRAGGRPRIGYPELRTALEASDLDAIAPRDALATVREAVLRLRRAKAMVLDPQDPDTRSAGSFFTNPVLSVEAFEQLQETALPDAVPRFPAADGIKVPAAWLVERAGFHKGHVQGGVGISSKHSLALVNRGGTAADLMALSTAIRAAVRERFGVSLELEPVYVT